MSTATVKRVLDNTAVRSVATALAALYMWLVYVTTRWEVEGQEFPEALWSRNEAFVLAVWHGRLLMVAPHWPHGKPIAALISKHRDGELIARTVAWHGFGAVRGSTHGGDGAAALHQLVRKLKQGTTMVFTPDGPRGPRMRAGDGIVAAARLSGATIIPFAFGATRRRLLESWDRFLIPLPFGRGIIVWGAPIRIARDATESEVTATRLCIEAAISEMTDRADYRTGHTPVPPEPTAASAEAAE